MTLPDYLAATGMGFLSAAIFSLSRRIRWLENQRPLVGPKGEPGSCQCDNRRNDE